MSLRPPTKQIGAFLLGVLTFAAIAGLPNAQTLAADGLSSVFLLVLGAIITLTPTALISGELATMYVADGGVYTWVSAAFGPRMGFMCIFVQWAVQLILIVTVLAYLTATLGIAFGSTSFGANRWAIMGVVVVVIVVATALNLLGLRDVGLIGVVAMTIATIIPAAMILGLGFAMAAETGHANIAFNWSNVMPEVNNTSAWASIGGAIVAYTGLEISAAFVAHLRRPVRDYLLGITGAAIVTIILMVLVTLVIAMAIPAKEINLITGLPVTIRSLAEHFGVGWFGSVILVGIVFGFTLRMTNVLIGPATSLITAAEKGHLPRILAQRTARGVPRNLLGVQMVIIIAIGMIFAFTPAQQAFWILIVVATNVYLIMYIVMYLAALRLRYTAADLERPFRVGPNWVMWIVAGIGSLVSLGVIVADLLPRELQGGTALSSFYLVTTIGTGLLLVAPYVIDALSQRDTGHPNADAAAG